MAKPSITGKTVDTVLELTGKFTENFVKALVGKGASATKQKNVSFDGKAKIKKDGRDTASKIKPLKQGNQLIDVLSKIYNFMNKNYEEDKLHRERLENFKEEEKLEADKRHKALLAQIELLMKERDGGKSTASKVENETGMSIEGVVGSILNAFGGARTAITVLSSLGAFLVSPVGLAILGTATVAGLAYLLYDTYKKGPTPEQAAEILRTTPPQAMTKERRERLEKIVKEGGETASKTLESGNADAIAAAGGEEKLRQQINNAGNTAELKPDMKVKPRPVPNGKNDLQIQSWDSKYGQTHNPDGTPKNIPEKKEVLPSAPEQKTQTPPSAPSTTKPVEPAPMTPPSAKLNEVQSQNNTAKVNALTEPSTSTINNISSSKVMKKSSVETRSKIPPVRNLEETFQKMITYSTRVV
jgi:hypothetical protein